MPCVDHGPLNEGAMGKTQKVIKTERRKKFLLLSLNINSRKEFYVGAGIRGV